jgi:hypothetical protein
VQELTSRFFSIASVVLLVGAILFALISSANSDETIANPATVSNDMKVHFSTGQFRTCPICGSETEEIDQGTFDGTAFRCKTHGEVEVTHDALSENRVASPDQWERAFQVAWTRAAAAAGGRPRIFTYDFVKE